MNLFSDLIEVLSKVCKGLKVLTDLTKKEREKYRDVLDETYRLIDTTLNMVIIRLGDILQEEDDVFLKGVEGLGNYDDWMKAEREFRLCKSLRAAVRETETIRDKLAGKISTADWDALLGLMNNVLCTEGAVAGYMCDKFWELSDSAYQSADLANLRTGVTDLRTTLVKERQQLIKQETELYDIL
ncbi:hypothetical protein PDESU_05277 [Pontiella desulfatans]|uniref:Uncharacterized protein n=1 Tax=Pontiella desulfatans TaxID=2750659 RepID=A0A6C2UBM7_PONDE|nr:hypothetical protein [Pontiella desulfatans]VGO16686.1 hypothetical protein PDESU_05277 [Pontiella desulfatans]